MPLQEVGFDLSMLILWPPQAISTASEDDTCELGIQWHEKNNLSIIYFFYFVEKWSFFLRMPILIIGKKILGCSLPVPTSMHIL